MTIETPTTETIEQICRAVIERGFNSGDLDGLDAFVAHDIVEHQDGATSGIDGLRAMITELRSQFSDLRLDIQDTATSGDTVWFRIRATGSSIARTCPIRSLVRAEANHASRISRTKPAFEPNAQ